LPSAVISRELARQNELGTHLANCTGQPANIDDGSEFAAYDDKEVRLQVTYAMFVVANELLSQSYPEPR